MLWADLRDALASIYPEDDSIRRVAEDALLSTRYLSFDGIAVDVWERVLREAARRGRLQDITRVAHHEYPENVAVNIANTVLQTGGQLRDLPSDVIEATPMAFDDRDQRELERIRMSIHKINNLLAEWDKQRAVREERDGNWQRATDKRLDKIDNHIEHIQRESAAYVSSRWVWIAAALFVVALTLGVWYLGAQSSPVRSSAPTIFQEVQP